MLSKEQYIKQIFEPKNEYRQDNQWVGNWDESWNDEPDCKVHRGRL